VTNISICQFNSISFTQDLIQALASGDEKHPEVKALRERTPLHYGYINKVLDEIYEAN
jgi:hypothetical protein